LPHLLEHLPGAIVNTDDFELPCYNFQSTAFCNTRRSWLLAGESDALMLEDDIILCSDFIKKVQLAIAQYPNKVIQFFTRRKNDNLGTRSMEGKTYSMCQCTYYPAGVLKSLYEYSNYYAKLAIHIKETAPIDPCIASFLAHNKMTYINHVPSLVQHIEGVSAINPKRAKKRISENFIA
jgi:GR25 family glycosyltransferase involved in LPS biosynthesis